MSAEQELTQRVRCIGCLFSNAATRLVNTCIQSSARATYAAGRSLVTRARARRRAARPAHVRLGHQSGALPKIQSLAVAGAPFAPLSLSDQLRIVRPDVASSDWHSPFDFVSRAGWAAACRCSRRPCWRLPQAPRTKLTAREHPPRARRRRWCPSPAANDLYCCGAARSLRTARGGRPRSWQTCACEYAAAGMRCGAAATLLGGMQHSWLWATAALLSAYPFG